MAGARVITTIWLMLALLKVAEQALVGYWPFGQYGGLDVSGNGNDAVLNDTEVVSGPTGMASGATYLKGRTTSYIEIPASPSLNVGNFTVIGRINFAELSEGPIFSWRSPFIYGTHLFMMQTGTRLYFRLKTIPGDLTVCEMYFNLELNTWHTFSTKYDIETGNTTLRFDHNIKTFTPADYVVPNHVTHTAIRIGVLPGDAFTRKLNASVAEFGLFDEALDIQHETLARLSEYWDAPSGHRSGCYLKEMPSPPLLTFAEQDAWESQGTPKMECFLKCIARGCRSVYHNAGNETCLVFSLPFPTTILDQLSGWTFYTPE